MSQRSVLKTILILIILHTMVGCGRRNTHFGLGIGIQIKPPKGVQKSLNLMSWYSSSSTSSTTMDKEEFLGTAQLKQFIESNNDLLFEELARGEGEHIEFLVKSLNFHKARSALDMMRIHLNQEILEENNFLEFIHKNYSI
jgi:hypothetical protein